MVQTTNNLAVDVLNPAEYDGELLQAKLKARCKININMTITQLRTKEQQQQLLSKACTACQWHEVTRGGCHLTVDNISIKFVMAS